MYGNREFPKDATDRRVADRNARARARYIYVKRTRDDIRRHFPLLSRRGRKMGQYMSGSDPAIFVFV